MILSSPGVVLPVEERLVVEELCACAVDDLPAEGLVLQELEEVEAERVLDEADVGGPLPVLQVGEVVDELGVPEVAALRQKVEVVGVAQALHELQLDLEADALLLVGVGVHGRGAAGEGRHRGRRRGAGRGHRRRGDRGGVRGVGWKLQWGDPKFKTKRQENGN